MTRLPVLAAGAVLLATTTLASCGFEPATDRPYTPAAGSNDQSGEVDVLAAVIVSKQAGSGTFVAGLSNSSTTEPISFDSLKSSGSEELTASTFTPIEIPAAGFVNLATVNGVEVSGDFTAGDFREVSVGFGNGQTSTLDVPVVTACDEYAGLDVSSPSAIATSPSGVPTDPPTSLLPTPASPGASTTTLSPSPSEFACDVPEVDSESSDAATAEAEE